MMPEVAEAVARLVEVGSNPRLAEAALTAGAYTRPLFSST